jgi:hypothetical protein
MALLVVGGAPAPLDPLLATLLLAIQFNISEQSMSRLIYTSSESKSPLVRSASCMFPLRHNMPMSSPKVC